MANVKNASIREIDIDQCLQAKGGRTVQQIMKVYGALEAMERFEGQAGFSWIEDLSAHLRTSLNMGKNSMSYIAYDDNSQLRGMQFH